MQTAGRANLFEMGATDGEDDPSSPQSLRAAGRLAEAAAAYRVRGDLAVAEKLFAEIWDFVSAAEVSRERGDRPAELGHLIAGHDASGAALLLQAIESGSQVELSKAADVLERHRRWVEAASLKERAGSLEAARELYRRGQALLDVARIERALGRLHEAGSVYEQLLQREPDGPDAARAHQALGQLLLTLDRPDEAAHHLQLALARGGTAAPLLESLVVALDCLGYPTAADDALDRLRELVPNAPSRVELVARQRAVSNDDKPRLAGRYEPIRLLGAGASGRVFLAKDLVTGRQVATKTIEAAPDKRSAASWARYFAETQRVAAVRHPNLVEILDVNPGMGLIVMEYVSGGTLADRLSTASRPMSTAAVQQLLLGVLDALAVLHAQGLVHRDLKPANLFVTATGQFKVGDFGSAYLLSEEATQTAGFVGTLAYMSPEQMTGAELDFSTDLYALGAVGFHAVTGRLPFMGPDFVSQHLGEQAPAPSSLRPALAPAWDRLFGALLQKHPRARPASIDEVRNQVLRLPMLSDEEREATRPQAAVEQKPARPRYQLEAERPSGAGGPIRECLDTQLERRVVVEVLGPDYLRTDEGMRHLAWLRELARNAGPRVQRIFALSPRADGAVEAVFEPAPAPSEAPLSLLGRERVRESLAPLHAHGVGHGSLSRSIALDGPVGPDAPVVVLAGRTPPPDAAVLDEHFLGA